MTLTEVNPEKLGLNRDRLKRLMTVLQDEVARKRLPGAVALVARHGQLALFDSVGYLNPDTGEAMHRDARFRIYSMTKPIMSVAAMMLMEEGRLLLVEPGGRIFARVWCAAGRAVSGWRIASAAGQTRGDPA